MKKIVSVLLALALTLTLVGSAVAEDKVNLTAFQYTLENQSTDFNNLWFFQQLEEKTNTHVDFTMVKDGDFQTQLNLMFISGKYMDMILRGSTDIEDYGVNQGLLMPLDEYITEDIMPNYVSRLNLNNAGDSIPASDGHSYYIGYLIAQNVNHNGTWYINTTLLDQLGLEVPTTIDEYTNVLRKFKEAGIKYPLSTSTFGYGPETIWNEFASFGVPENYAFYHITDDDKVEFTGTMPGWRACVEWLHMLYEEGLLDPEFATQDAQQWQAKVQANLCGVYSGSPTALDPSTTAQQLSLYPLTSETNDTPVAKQPIYLYPGRAFITDKCSDPVAAIRLLDMFYATEENAVEGFCGTTLFAGFEGEHWRYTDDTKTAYEWIAPITGFGDINQSVSVNMELPGLLQFEAAPSGNPLMEMKVSQVQEKQKPYYNLTNAYPSNVRFTADESERGNVIENDLYNQVVMMTTKFIIGDADIESGWEDYLVSLEKIGLSELIEIKTAALTRWNAAMAE